MRARVTFISGSRGSGKSHKAKELARPIPRLLVFDTLGNTSLPAAKITGSLEDVRRALIRWYDRGFTIIYRPPSHLLPEALSELSRVLMDVARAGQGRHEVILLAEELSLCFPEERQPAHIRGFYNLVLTGRNFGIGVIGVAQRAALVSKVFTGNTDDIYVFRPSEEPDYQRARAMIGASYDGQIRALLNRDFIYRDKTTGRVVVFKYKQK